LLLLVEVAVEVSMLGAAVQEDIGRAFLEKVLVVAHPQNHLCHLRLELITQLP
jgi:hypothetical protein